MVFGETRIEGGQVGSLAVARMRVRAAALHLRLRLWRGRTGPVDAELADFAHRIAVYSGLPQVTPAFLDDMVRRGQTPLLLDVRSAEEHAVSHISGARLVGQSSPLPVVISAIETGQPIVAYCSFGVRSTLLALRIEASLPKRHWAEIYNLDGGIFRWHREGRLLVDAGGPTTRIHPCDRIWRRLLEGR